MLYLGKGNALKAGVVIIITEDGFLILFCVFLLNYVRGCQFFSGTVETVASAVFQ